jgi:TatA/E family protein of Tat protein translocase
MIGRGRPAMFGLGVPELIFIFVLALLIFGPKRLPELGRTVGRGLAEFHKASTELQRTINTELALDEPVLPPSLRPNRLLDSLVTPRTAPPASPAPEAAPVPAPASRETVDEAVLPADNEPVEPA